MFQAIFNSLSGMFGFSKGLDTVSNNVANMNTPGFLGSNAFFENVNGSTPNDSGEPGYGTKLGDTSIDFSQGNIQQTGVASDLALNGSGFFILRNTDGKDYYTRSGQFQFDQNGYLIDSATKDRVQGLDAAGNLTDISIASLKTIAPQATTTINLTGNLSPSDPTDTINNVTVYDASGNAQTLNLAFTNNSATTPNSWTVDVTDASGNNVGTGTVQFASDGSPASGGNSFTVTLGSGSAAQTIKLNFGTAGSYTGATELSGSPTSLAAAAADGHASASMTGYSFDTTGTMQLTYSDGETKSGPQVALAYFPDQSVLTSAGSSLFTASDTTKMQTGKPGQGVFASIEGGSLEMSNVNLTNEFGQMIVLQQGYQASSRVMSIANDLLTQLYNNTPHG